MGTSSFSPMTDVVKTWTFRVKNNHKYKLRDKLCLKTKFCNKSFEDIIRFMQESDGHLIVANVRSPC